METGYRQYLTVSTTAITRLYAKARHKGSSCCQENRRGHALVWNVTSVGRATDNLVISCHTLCHGHWVVCFAQESGLREGITHQSGLVQFVGPSGFPTCSSVDPAACGRLWPALAGPWLVVKQVIVPNWIAVSFIKQFRWETMKNGKQTQVWSCCASSATSRNQGRSLALINSKFSIPPQVCSTGATGATGAGLGPSQHLRDIVLSNSLVRGMWIHQCAASLIEPLQTCKLAGSAPAEMYFVLKTPKKSTYRSSSTTVYLQPTLNIPKPHCCAWTFGGWSSNSWELSDFWTLLRWWWRCRWQIHLNGLAWFSFHWQSHCTLILCKLQGEDFTSWKWQPSHLLHWRKALWELCTVCTC